MKEIRRCAKVLVALPDGQSCRNLAVTRLRHIARGQWNIGNICTWRRPTRRRHRPAEPSPGEMCERVWTLPLAQLARLRFFDALVEFARRRAVRDRFLTLRIAMNGRECGRLDPLRLRY